MVSLIRGASRGVVAPTPPETTPTTQTPPSTTPPPSNPPPSDPPPPTSTDDGPSFLLLYQNAKV